MELSGHFDYKRIMKFTSSSIFMMIFISIYSVVDGMFISNFAGSDAFAAMNLIYPVISIIGAFGFMMGTGGCALVSKTLGEGDQEKANNYFTMLIKFVVIMGLILTVVGIFLVKPIAILLKAEGAILDGCITYGVGLLIPITFFMLQNTFHSFLVLSGKPDLGLKLSILSGITNLIGDFILVYLLKMGLLGACIATGAGQVLGGLLPFVYFTSKKQKRNISFGKAKLELKPLVSSAYNGVSEMLSNISMSLIMVLYNWQLMNTLGSMGVVSYGVSAYLQFVFAAVFIGYEVGVAPIVGYNYGAQNHKELKSILKKSMLIISVFAVAMFISSFGLAGTIAKIFVGYDQELMILTKKVIEICAFSFIFNGFGIFVSSFFTALNNGFVSGMLSTFRTFIFQAIAILALPLILGSDGIWWAVVASEGVAAIFSIILLIMFRKKYKYM